MIKGKLKKQTGEAVRKEGRGGRKGYPADRATNRDRNTINVGSCFQNESAAQKKPQHQQTLLGQKRSGKGGLAYHGPRPEAEAVAGRKAEGQAEAETEAVAGAALISNN